MNSLAHVWTAQSPFWWALAKFVREAHRHAAGRGEAAVVMPPSMTFSTSMRAQRTPSERAAVDAEREEAAKQRKAQYFSPGPGQYNPDKVRSGRNARLADTRGEYASSSFQSKIDRAKAPSYDPPLASGDPGAYSAGKKRDGGNATLADMRGETASHTFKSASKRELEPELFKPKAGPGPGQYSPGKGRKGANATLADMRGESASHAFKSTSAQRLHAKQSEIPGPGQYSPGKGHKGANATLADMRGEVRPARAPRAPRAFVLSSARADVAQGECATMKSTSAQFSKGLSSQTGPEVGPGLYEPGKRRTGENAELSDARGETGSSSFESESRRPLPW